MDVYPQAKSQHDLVFTSIPTRWDHGIPLGNGMLGALVWQKGSYLRISLDRADLWDERPIPELGLPQFTYKWVQEQVKNGTYDTVQKLFDWPYEREAAPTKIPAGALEIPIQSFGEVDSVRLNLEEATCKISWKDGSRLSLFVDANQPLGWFQLDSKDHELTINFVPPPYNDSLHRASGSSVNGRGLARLGYPPGRLDQHEGSIYFQQKGWGGFVYDVSVSLKKVGLTSTQGVWSISTKGGPYSPDKSSWTYTKDAMEGSYSQALEAHLKWWKEFWSKSSIELPDTILENQWYREMYKFGSASRKGAPPITLQAVWTADNGSLPPWKGDFHHDLNTQMSYWPGYTSNHLEESSVFTDWLWRFRSHAANYSETYFDVKGFNYPGVSTLSGKPIGGWIQYACSPTTSAWLAQSFYNQWKYSGDSLFLVQQAYPFIFSMASFLDNLSIEDSRSKKQLPISSSPEFNDNSIHAWFPKTTNYDLSLIRWTYEAAIEMAIALGKEHEAHYWENMLEKWPQLALSEQHQLEIAPGIPYAESHRHFSHLMSIYPLGLFNSNLNKKQKEIIDASIHQLITNGTGNWCGYSYAWLGALQARARNGDAAADALRTFSTCFCFPNSFHANGDQSGSGKSGYTYSPFTLEGNFACAAAIQEMLLQSFDGVIRVFPAIPNSWKNLSFNQIRAEGGFLISAHMDHGMVSTVEIVSEKGGLLIVENPFKKKHLKIEGVNKVVVNRKNQLEFKTLPNQRIKLSIQ